jgi:transposase-like protein
VDWEGSTLNFMLGDKRDGKAAARFFRKVLKGQHIQALQVVTVDKNAAYPVAIEVLKEDETIDQKAELRQSKYLNNIVEQDHRAIKRIVKPMMGFKTFNSARKTLSGIEYVQFFIISDSNSLQTWLSTVAQEQSCSS